MLATVLVPLIVAAGGEPLRERDHQLHQVDELHPQLLVPDDAQGVLQDVHWYSGPIASVV